MPVAILLIVFGAHISFLYIINLKILSIALTTERRMVNRFCSPISFEDMSHASQTQVSIKNK